jgi:REP element-mobilizing transposase RayT
LRGDTAYRTEPVTYLRCQGNSESQEFIFDNLSGGMHFPLAYHITFGTYGTRLHGDERGTIDRTMNKFGEPIVGVDVEWQQIERSLLKFPPRVLTLEQRLFIEEVVPSVCIRGGWKHLATAAAPDHVHNVLSAEVEGKDVRKWLKRWVSEAMNERWTLQEGEVWWAECGSVRWVWTEDYYERAIDYVKRQMTRR